VIYDELRIVNLHEIQSDLNGNNGSATNTDDLAAPAPAAVHPIGHWNVQALPAPMAFTPTPAPGAATHWHDHVRQNLAIPNGPRFFITKQGAIDETLPTRIVTKNAALLNLVIGNRAQGYASGHARVRAIWALRAMMRIAVMLIARYVHKVVLSFGLRFLCLNQNWTVVKIIRLMNIAATLVGYYQLARDVGVLAMALPKFGHLCSWWLGDRLPKSRTDIDPDGIDAADVENLDKGVDVYVCRINPAAVPAPDRDDRVATIQAQGVRCVSVPQIRQFSVEKVCIRQGSLGLYRVLRTIVLEPTNVDFMPLLMTRIQTDKNMASVVVQAHARSNGVIEHNTPCRDFGKDAYVRWMTRAYLQTYMGETLDSLQH
jgi:hypothetical protein